MKNHEFDEIDDLPTQNGQNLMVRVNGGQITVVCGRGAG